jgi:signal transduction histidine kinase
MQAPARDAPRPDRQHRDVTHGQQALDRTAGETARIPALPGLAITMIDAASREEIARLARTMNDMLERLEHSQGSQRRFVANASHELRTPLASALTQLQVDQAHPGTADWPATAAGIQSELERLQRLVVDLLGLARSDEGALAQGRRAVDLDELVRE